MKILLTIFFIVTHNHAFSQCSPSIDLPFSGNASDVSGNANHGTASGTPSLTQDRFGSANSAYRLGGVGDVDYFTVSHNAGLVLSKYLSVSFWMRQCDFTGMDGWGATVARGYHCLWAKQGDGISVQPGFWSFSSSTTSGTMWNSFNNVNWFPSSVTNFSNTANLDCFDTCEWVHIVHVIDSNKQRIYFNGVLKQEFTITTADFSSANTRPLIIGKMDGTWYPYRGDIDDFKYYKCALNPSTIGSLYGGYTSPKQANNVIRIDSIRINKISCTNNTLNLYPDTLAGPFQYSKDSGTTWQTSNGFTNLTTGTYKIAIKSACTRKDSTIIIQPCVFDLDVSGSFSTCLDTISIAQNLTITDGDPSAFIDGAKVFFDAGYIKKEDSLIINSQFGISVSFDTATGVLHISGNATKFQYETVLKTIKYKNLKTNKTISTKSIRFVLGKALYNNDNGHHYKLVNHGSPITWIAARDSAAVSRHFGLQGYLVTITSNTENQFLANLINSKTWIGASDFQSEGVWRWVTGCEGLETGGLGRHFSNQQGVCGSIAGSGVSVSGNYQNWSSIGEPNDASCNEDYGHFLYNHSPYLNFNWNDLPDNPHIVWGSNWGVPTYIIEYGCMPNDPIIDIQGSVTVNIEQCCRQDFSWTTWTNFNSNSATGNITGGINVNMSANYSFSSTPTIFNYAMFNGLYNIPNSTCPRTEWSPTSGIGVTTFCFNQFVDNPVLLLASLGSQFTPVTLKFSRPFIVEFDGGANVFVNDTTIIGNEGYSIIQFPGKLDCITVYSTTPEIYTNITFGLNIPKFSVTMIGDTASCDTAKLQIVGGRSYKWSKGLYPDSSINYFTTSGLTNLTVTDSIGCKVYRAYNIVIKNNKTSIFSQSICQGDSFAGRTTAGIYIDTFLISNGCDSIRTLNLKVNPITTSNTTQAICSGQNFWGYTTTGVYRDTFRNANSKGCDSIRILNLTASPNILKILTITQCNAYFFKGQNRTTTGTYRDTTKLASGCDSITELQLTIPMPINQTIDTVSCDSFIYKNLRYIASQIINETIRSSIGCDSIYRKINLTVLKPRNLIETNITGCKELVIQGVTYIRDTIILMRTPMIGAPFCDSLIKRVNIKIHPLPNATLRVVPDTIVKYGSEVELLARGGLQYKWNVSNERKDKITIPVKARTYVEVTVTDNKQCDSTVGLWLDVLPKLETVEIFSPNGDGQNDFFVPRIQGNVAVHSWRVFNRWGQKIYESVAINPGWDGTYAGQEQPQGSYVYQIEYTIGGERKMKTGAITLIR